MNEQDCVLYVRLHIGLNFAEQRELRSQALPGRRTGAWLRDLRRYEYPMNQRRGHAEIEFAPTDTEIGKRFGRLDSEPGRRCFRYELTIGDVIHPVHVRAPVGTIHIRTRSDRTPPGDAVNPN